MEENPVPELLAAAIDRGKASVKEALWKASLAIAVALAGGILLVIATASAFYGAALGLAEAFGGRVWLGYLTAGSGFLLLVALGLLALRLRSRWARRKLARKAEAATEQVASTLDPRPWIREHPWQTTGLAALGGFAMGFRMDLPGFGGGAGEKTFVDQLIDAGLDVLKNALTPLVATEVAKKISQYQQN